ncbi:MAG: hypothetical protein MK214_16655 [Thalassotalea sp.]|nr:hypothetical protein [Thalassotalea sp.]
MNKIIVSIAIASVCGGLLYKAYDSEPDNQVEQPKLRSASSEKSDYLLQNLANDSSKGLEVLAQDKSSVPLKDSETFLDGLAERDRDAFGQANERLFGVLENISEEDYQKLIDKGFPSTRDFDFVSKYDIKELSNTLSYNGSTYPSFDKDSSISYPALSSLNLLRALANLEEVTRYYFPEYQQGTPFPKSNDWPDGERPAQVVEALMKMISAYGFVRDDSAIELLAQARYQQLAFSADDNNADRVVEKLATANKLLGGDDNLLSFVTQHYPDKLDYFKELSIE